GAVHVLVVEAALVAQPPLVDGVAVYADQPGQPVARALHDDTAPHRTRRTRTFDLFQVPRPGPEAVGRGEQRADRADLHGVAAEVRRERLIGEGVHLDRVAPVHELDQRVTADLLGETGAAGALDAPLA